jgi:hypothetical protein
MQMKAILVGSLCALLLASGATEPRHAVAIAPILPAIAAQSIQTGLGAASASASGASSVREDTADRQTRFGPVHIAPGFVLPRGADDSHDIPCPGVDPCP